jgi:hypothetical protein
MTERRPPAARALVQVSLVRQLAAVLDVVEDMDAHEQTAYILALEPIAG